MEDLKKYIRDIQNFPKEGILFKDITTLLKDKNGLKETIDAFTTRYKDKGIDYVVGADARGFIFASVLAYNIGAGFIPVRKKGKLPAEVYSVSYDLEYGTSELEIHKDAIEEGKKVLIIDDLLATGGTARAMVELIEKTGGIIHELAFLIELEFLKGKDILKGYNAFSLLKY